MRDFQAARIEAGISINQLSTLTRYSKSHICNVQNGSAKPSIEYIKAFDAALANPNQLAGSNPDMPIRARSAERAKRDLAIKSGQLSSELEVIAQFADKLKSLQRLTKDIQEASIAALGETRKVVINPAVFDPRDVPEELYGKVGTFIADVLVDMLCEYNFYLQSEKERKVLLDGIKTYVLAELDERAARKSQNR